jgi:hypothetical protein
LMFLIMRVDHDIVHNGQESGNRASTLLLFGSM